MGISDHVGKQNTFLSHCLVIKNKKALQVLQFSELSKRNKGPSFHNLTFLLRLLRYRL